ncbi:hypothetical protein [Brevibacillus invocatus]|uniref:hypothetical protein n=1 Tax=Brevibacillus invocatus TaxID=173959 RepID=UPI0011CE95F6|nr:hypothetical protein [Brevibacillus invocatus]
MIHSPPNVVDVSPCHYRSIDQYGRNQPLEVFLSPSAVGDHRLIRYGLFGSVTGSCVWSGGEFSLTGTS